ncbi:Adenylate kinase [uncultured archaeon]|nr:Adenylate kinase [uncultured archaeon]
MKKSKVVIIFGPPGVGKGTQAELLSANLGYAHLSTGAVLRDEMARETDLGKRLIEIGVPQGNYAPDDMMIELVEGYLDRNTKSGVILDGFPRTMPQARKLADFFNTSEKYDVEVVSLAADGSELVKRLLLRAQVQKRADDTEEVIKRRLEIYQTQTTPLLDFYKGLYKFEEVNGIGKIEDIQEEILSRLSK